MVTGGSPFCLILAVTRSDRQRYFRFSRPEVALQLFMNPYDAVMMSLRIYVAWYVYYNRFIESYTQLISSSVVYRFSGSLRPGTAFSQSDHVIFNEPIRSPPRRRGGDLRRPPQPAAATAATASDPDAEYAGGLCRSRFGSTSSPTG